MTRQELDWVLNEASNFMVTAIVGSGHEVYNFTAFSSPLNDKIPIRFILEGRMVDYLVLDYNREKVLDTCCGIIAREKTILLDCDLPQNGGLGIIEYHIDEELTFNLHKHFSTCFEYVV